MSFAYALYAGDPAVDWNILIKVVMSNSPHTFLIPVMGTGFTVDTPLHVARYGISSVISLVEDLLLEQMREYHLRQAGESYEPITEADDDCRAKRITAYLNLLDRLVKKQVSELQASDFVPGSEITRYFELLPPSPLKTAYQQMLGTESPDEKKRLQEELRVRAVPGSIDVNIMTKLDRDRYRGAQKIPAEFADAMAALRGFAQSNLSSSIVFSAGLNTRLYGYLSEFEDFFPNADGQLKKRIVLKVSDYRSAIIQGKYLAKRGLWVSEFRVESGLNCGGHAFASEGFLLGPNLEEFKKRREELCASLHGIYCKALAKRGLPVPRQPYRTAITVQGGIGTAEEDQFLLRYYQVDATGWGSPFLLVPEATNVDDAHLEKLLAATESDVYLSRSSPMGIPFWNLRTSASEEVRRARIENGTPGSPCPRGHLRCNLELSEVPLCLASRTYVRKKLEQLQTLKPTPQVKAMEEEVLVKSCICYDLGGGARIKLGIDPGATPAICCGPNIVNFKSIASLEEMVGHIYGRSSLMANPDRPHMFIRELMLYVEYLRNEIDAISQDVSTRAHEYFHKFKSNLLSGVEYYRGLAENFGSDEKERFLSSLKQLRATIDGFCMPVECTGSLPVD